MNYNQLRSSNATKREPLVGLFLGNSRDGKEVYNRHKSHIHEMPNDLLAEAISRVDLGSKDFAKETIEMGRIIGRSTCVATKPADTIVYAQRENRGGLSRFVLNRSPEDCSSIVAVFKKAQDHPKAFILITAFIGTSAEPEPWDQRATPAAFKFWQSNALIWGSEPVIVGSETHECPWPKSPALQIPQDGKPIVGSRRPLEHEKHEKTRWPYKA